MFTRRKARSGTLGRPARAAVQTTIDKRIGATNAAKRGTLPTVGRTQQRQPQAFRTWWFLGLSS